MKVNIKDLGIELAVKNKGVEFEIRSMDGKQLGDLVVNKRGLTWCKGKTKAINGKSITWQKFIEFAESR